MTARAMPPLTIARSVTISATGNVATTYLLHASLSAKQVVATNR